MKLARRVSAAIALGFAALSATALPLAPAHAAAQAADYPDKPVKIIVPYPPGGTNDIVVRLVGKKLGEQLGQPIIVENKAGASGNIGAESVARAPADGYTLLLVTTGHAIHPSLYKNLRYDITKDLMGVSRLSSGPMLVMVNPKLGINNIQDLIARAKAEPGAMFFSSAGNGSSTHLTTELLASKAGIKLTHVPFNGSAPAMSDVMAGNTQVVLDLMFSALPQVQSGRLKAIAITGTARSPLLPDVPTVAESGVAGFDAEVWNGLMVPANTPQPIVDRLNAELKKVLADPDIKTRLDAQGFPASWSTPAEFDKQIASEIKRWAPVVQASGATVQ